MALEKRTTYADNKPNKWRIRVTRNGKPYTENFYGTKKEAKEFERDFIYKIEKGMMGSNENTLFKDFYNQYKSEYLFKLKGATKSYYDDIYKAHLKEAFGNTRLKDITPLMIQSFINKLIKSKEKYTPNTINCIAAVLRAILNKAEEWEIINRTPYRHIETPKPTKTNISKLTMEQLKLLIDSYEHEHVPSQKCGFFLALTTGMRTSEIRALTLDDINFESKTITVNKQIGVHGDEKGKNIDTKNYSSTRVINVSSTTLNYLSEYISTVSTWNKEKQLFFKNGHVVSLPYFRVYLTRRCKELGLPHITFHDLRHFNATLLIQNNANIASVSNMLGHSNTTTTLNIYTNPINEYNIVTANKMDNIFATLK